MNNNKKKQKVIIGVSSGIAACKVPLLIKKLKDSDLDMHVVMTSSATKMVPPDEFRKASGNRVYTGLFPEGFDYKDILQKREVEHVSLAGSASLIAIVPATANIIAKIAHGIADDFLTTLVLGATSPVLLCPSMNSNMWNNKVVQENIRKLKNLGFYILSPVSGALACGSIGIGRLPEIDVIKDEILEILENKNRLSGKRILVTGGGTKESIDAVRVIANRGSGKMGAAIADECKKRGAQVLFLKSNNNLTPTGAEEMYFETSDDLEKLLEEKISSYDVLFHSAAVSDYIPENVTAEKLDSGKHISLMLIPRGKILHKIKNWNPKIILVGFKAVYRMNGKEIIKEGIAKLKISGSDYIIVNDVGKPGIGFGAEENEAYIISPKGLIAKIDKAPKNIVAGKILDIIFPK